MLYYLGIEQFRTTPLVRQPFEHLIVPQFIATQGLAEINADYPKISTSGSFPADQVVFGPAFQTLLDELNSEAFREAFEDKFEIDLSGRPTFTTGQPARVSVVGLIQVLFALGLDLLFVDPRFHWAPLAGIALNIAAVMAAIVIMALVAFALTNLGLIIAWRIDSTQGFHAIMNLILLPIWMLSGAFFPAAGAPGLLAWIMRLDPLTYGMSALRQSLYLAHPGALGSLPNLTFSAILTVAFAAVTYLGAVRVASHAVTV